MKSFHTVVVDPSGIAAIRDLRPMHEAARIAAVKAAGAVPDACGDKIIAAPARGPVRAFTPLGKYPEGETGYVYRDAGYKGKKALQRGDQFDAMRVRALRAGRPLPFTKAQEDVARAYRHQNDELASCGLSCSSLMQGGGGSSDRMEILIDGFRQMDLWQKRVGTGIAWPSRKIRPSERGTKSEIRDRDLVDMFCLYDKYLSQILVKHGWRNTGKNIAALRLSLCSALDRMAGPKSRMVRAGESLTIDGLARRDV